MYRTIPQLLVEAAERDPDGDWLRVDDGTLTFAGATAAVAGVAERLRERGIGHGDLVVLTARTTPPYLLGWLALASLGAIAVPTNPASTAAEFGGLLGQTQPRAVITDAELAPTRFGGATVLDVDDLVRRLVGAAAADLSVGDGSPTTSPCLIPTSGTTGRSKLVMQTHRAYAMAGEGFPYWMELTAADRLMTSLPLFHINAPAYSVLGSLACGAGLVLLPRFSASGFLDAARRHGATEFNAIGAMLEILMRQPERPDDADNAAASLLHRAGTDAGAAGADRGAVRPAHRGRLRDVREPVRADLAARFATVRHARHGAAASDAGRGERGAGRRPRTAPTPPRASCCCAIPR